LLKILFEKTEDNTDSYFAQMAAAILETLGKEQADGEGKTIRKVEAIINYSEDKKEALPKDD
jgi:hypothetical protein